MPKNDDLIEIVKQVALGLKLETMRDALNIMRTCVIDSIDSVYIEGVTYSTINPTTLFNRISNRIDDLTHELEKLAETSEKEKIKNIKDLFNNKPKVDTAIEKMLKQQEQEFKEQYLNEPRE